MEDANKELIDLRVVPFDHVKMLASNKILKMNTMNLQNQPKKIRFKHRVSLLSKCVELRYRKEQKKLGLQRLSIIIIYDKSFTWKAFDMISS